MKAMKRFQNNKIVIAVMFFVVIVVAVFTENSVDSMVSHFQFQEEGTYGANVEHASKESSIDEKYTLDQKVLTGFISVEKPGISEMSALSVRKLNSFERKELAVYFYSVLAVLFKIALIPNFILLFTITCSFFFARSRILRFMYKRDGKKRIYAFYH